MVTQRPVKKKKNKEGLESVCFKFELTQDAAVYSETKDNLENYAAVSYKQNSVEGVKYMEDMEAPSYTDPEEPTDPTNRVSYKKWDRKFDNYDQSVQNWKENKRKSFNLMLLQLPMDMDERQLSMDGWIEAKEVKYVMNLLVMIRSIFHRHDKTKQGTMAPVKIDMVLYTMW